MMHHHMEQPCTKFNRSDILSGQTLPEISNSHRDHDLEYNKGTFSHDTPAYEHALLNYGGREKERKKKKKKRGKSSTDHMIIKNKLDFIL